MQSVKHLCFLETISARPGLDQVWGLVRFEIQFLAKTIDHIFQDGQVALHTPHSLHDLFILKYITRAAHQQMQQPEFQYQFGDTNRVGSYPAGASPFEALDMAGNVAEWVNDYYSGTYYSQNIDSNPTGPNARSSFFARVVRGGSFGDSKILIRVSKRSQVTGSNLNADVGSAAYLGDFSPRIGFRCAANN